MFAALKTIVYSLTQGRNSLPRPMGLLKNIWWWASWDYAENCSPPFAWSSSGRSCPSVPFFLLRSQIFYICVTFQCFGLFGDPFLKKGHGDARASRIDDRFTIKWLIYIQNHSNYFIRSLAYSNCLFELWSLFNQNLIKSVLWGNGFVPKINSYKY